MSTPILQTSRSFPYLTSPSRLWSSEFAECVNNVESCVFFFFLIPMSRPYSRRITWECFGGRHAIPHFQNHSGNSSVSQVWEVTVFQQHGLEFTVCEVDRKACSKKICLVRPALVSHCQCCYPPCLTIRHHFPLENALSSPTLEAGDLRSFCHGFLPLRLQPCIWHTQWRA